ncbi:MAG: hypothetical protein M1828_003649 [Chrysothrix sp. TS-e1954]|nr:MAG: hypothetical protein M1828_003649 [Chrysothrix sp. TS-e1954]
MITKILLYTTGAIVGATAAASVATRQFPPHVLLSAAGFKRVTLTSSTPSGTVARHLTFQTHEPKALAPLTLTSSTLLLAFKPGSTLPTIRPYTPVNSTHGDDTTSRVELCVKKYAGGAMSEFLHSLSPSSGKATSPSSVEQQPIIYVRRLPFGASYAPSSAKSVSLIAGGSGITPCYQLLNGILTDPSQSSTKVTLVMGAPKRDEEMLKPEIEQLEKTYSSEGRFKVVRVFGDGDTKAGEMQGKITKDVLETYLPKAENEATKLYLCGPEGMQQAVVGKGRGIGGWLGEMGWKKDQVTVF